MSRKKITGNTRRQFLQKSTIAVLSAALGAEMVFGKNFPAHLTPAGLWLPNDPTLPGKRNGLLLLSDKPLNVETPAHLLDESPTPADLFFVRNNGIPPEKNLINPETWTLTIDGESVLRPISFSLPELKSKFKSYTYQLTLECAGNGRKEFYPPADGNQWALGAVGCASFTGVRLKDVLQAAGLKKDAVYIGYYGKDTHLNGDPKKVPISRGVPIAKALEDESLIAWEMNGKELPWLNGFPLRLVFGGWPASTSGKWLHRISVRNKEHDGEKMKGKSYRMPCSPVGPGEEQEGASQCIIESMPVKSLITFPKSGATIPKGKLLPIRGYAWAGDHSIKSVDYSYDFGSSWYACKVNPPANRLAWQQFEAQIALPAKGYYEIWARATDSNGKMQPMVVPGWNSNGYLNNACHRIAVKVG